jgi:uncharacterized Fe-S cluster protein YjdI
MKEVTKKYSNGEVTIVWKPALCIHSAICINGLSEVFHTKELPWITPEKSSTDKIIEQVKKCPSGALSYFLNRDSESSDVKVDAEIIVETAINGPLMVYGNVTVKDANGNLTKKNNVTAFCRCGASANKPFCDGVHKKIGFVG